MAGVASLIYLRFPNQAFQAALPVTLHAVDVLVEVRG